VLHCAAAEEKEPRALYLFSFNFCVHTCGPINKLGEFIQHTQPQRVRVVYAARQVLNSAADPTAHIHTHSLHSIVYFRIKKAAQIVGGADFIMMWG
jgi:hypothetical protein